MRGVRIIKAAVRVALGRVRALRPRLPFEVVLAVVVLWWLPQLLLLLNPFYWDLVRRSLCQL